MATALTVSELPTDDGTLFLINLEDGTGFGIGTADEIRGLAEREEIPAAVRMTEVTDEIAAELLAA